MGASLPAGSGLTIALWLLAVSVLAGRRCRWFRPVGAVMWMVECGRPCIFPARSTAAFLFVAYVIALLANMPAGRGASLAALPYARPVLVLLLAMQILISVHYSVDECLFPFFGRQANG